MHESEIIRKLSGLEEARLLVVSDSHRDTTGIMRLLLHVPRTDVILHLGDHEADYTMMAEAVERPVLAVRGNCDRNFADPNPEKRFFALNGFILFALHGHQRPIEVKTGLERLRTFVRSMQPLPDFVFFGHTHRCHDETFIANDRTVRMLNPGSARGFGSQAASGLEIVLNRDAARIKRITSDWKP